MMNKNLLWLPLATLLIPTLAWAPPPSPPSSGGSGDLLSTNNLSDVANATTSLGNLGGESSTSNNIDPDRLAGDVTDDNLVDSVILQADIPLHITQSATLGDAGTLTPTAGYDFVDIKLTCSADPSGIVMTEGGSEVDGSRVLITNIGANECTFAWADTVLQHNGGTGTSISLSQWDTLELTYRTDRWVAAGGMNDSFFAESINLDTGPIRGAVYEVIKTANATLTTAEMAGTAITNYGETDDADLILTGTDIDTIEVMNFIYTIATAMATQDTCFKAAADNLINFDGTDGADNGCVCNATPAKGDSLACYSLTTGASVTDWFCKSGTGTWATVADNTGDCPD